MTHGIAGYYQEWARFDRRLSATIALCSLALALCAGAFLLPTPAFLRPLLPKLVRFGFEGRDQYVQRIILQQYTGEAHELGRLGPTTLRVQTRKGGDRPTPKAVEGRAVVRRPRIQGEGLADTTLSIRTVSRLPNIPLVQSEELVIERLVEPIYPDEAVQRSLEGRVQIQALVDTSGAVADVQVLGGAGIDLLEQAAEAAVWECRFRPYAESGVKRAVYAIFRFNFKLAD